MGAQLDSRTMIELLNSINVEAASDFGFTVRTYEDGQYGSFTKRVNAKDQASAWQKLVRELNASKILQHVVKIEC